MVVTHPRRWQRSPGDEKPGLCLAEEQTVHSTRIALRGSINSADTGKGKPGQEARAVEGSHTPSEIPKEYQH